MQNNWMTRNVLWVHIKYLQCSRVTYLELSYSEEKYWWHRKQVWQKSFLAYFLFFFFPIPADYVRGSITHCIVAQHLIFRAEAQTTRSSFHMHRFCLVLRPIQLESIFKVWVWHGSLAGFHWSFYLLDGESQRICWICLCLVFLSENWRNKKKIRNPIIKS